MKRMNMRPILAVVLVLALSLICFAGCAQQPTSLGTELATGGVLCLKVNPEIAIRYDENGNVTALEARNEDAKAILAGFTGFEGKPTKEVVSQLVGKIGEAGYFVEEIEGKTRKIVIEIEPGSTLPNGTFLDDVVAEVQTKVNNHDWNSPINIEGYTDYDYTDYGTVPPQTTTPTGTTPAVNPGHTDYDDTDYDITDYGTVPATTAPAQTKPASKPGRTDYTDYHDTDYGPNNDGVTDYTDYGKTDYDTTDYGKTDYDKDTTDYGKTDYTDYGK